MPLNDHTLLLQLERTYDAVEAKLHEVEADLHNHENVCDECDCSCAWSDIDDVKDEIGRLRDEMLDEIRGVRSDIDALNDTLQELRARVLGMEAR